MQALLISTVSTGKLQLSLLLCSQLQGKELVPLTTFEGPPATPSYPPKVDKNVFFNPPLRGMKPLNFLGGPVPQNLKGTDPPEP